MLSMAHSQLPPHAPRRAEARTTTRRGNAAHCTHAGRARRRVAHTQARTLCRATAARGRGAGLLRLWAGVFGVGERGEVRVDWSHERGHGLEVKAVPAHGSRMQRTARATQHTTGTYLRRPYQRHVATPHEPSRACATARTHRSWPRDTRAARDRRTSQTHATAGGPPTQSHRLCRRRAPTQRLSAARSSHG
jgi:hypothetical protein